MTLHGKSQPYGEGHLDRKFLRSDRLADLPQSLSLVSTLSMLSRNCNLAIAQVGTGMGYIS